MHLSKENIETSNNAFDPSGTTRDLGRMDQQQLSDFIRKAAVGEKDDEFLPRRFFAFFDAHAHGPSKDGRFDPPGFAYYMVERHEIFGLIERDVYQLHGNPPDFGFRRRFRNVISELLDELLNIEGIPTPEQGMLARFSVDVVGEFPHEEEISNAYPSGTMTERLRQDLDELQAVKPRWMEKVRVLIESGKFGPLQYS